MGTTTTALLLLGGCAFVAHVGDSRCYLLRGDKLLQISEDHSLVNEQIKAGLLTREQAKASRHKNIITRSVGFEPDVAVDTFAMPVRPGDSFLLCSDGCSNLVNDEELAEALGNENVTSVPASLISLANERGGDDNVTVVCVRVAGQ